MERRNPFQLSEAAMQELAFQGQVMIQHVQREQWLEETAKGKRQAVKLGKAARRQRHRQRRLWKLAASTT